MTNHRPRPSDLVRSLEWDEPIFVSGDVSLRTVASTLDRFHVGAVVVARGEDDAAVVSERDIVGVLSIRDLFGVLVAELRDKPAL